MSDSRPTEADRRSARSRNAIFAAFRELFFASGIDGFDVGELTERANVGRSTFYKHFRGKNELLVESLTPMLSRLAEACVDDAALPDLSFVPEHFWANRRFARTVLSGRSLVMIERALATMIEQRLIGVFGEGGLLLPPVLVAAQLAAGQMALLDHWLRGHGASTPGNVARALHLTSRVTVRGLLAT